MTQALQTGDIGDICAAGEALGNETGFRWEPWTEAVATVASRAPAGTRA